MNLPVANRENKTHEVSSLGEWVQLFVKKFYLYKKYFILGYSNKPKSIVMSEMNPTYHDFFSQWSHLGYSVEQIEADLQDKGFIKEKVDEIIQLYKKHRSAAKSTRGFICMVIGALVGFTSCMFTLLDIFPEMREFDMVGLTSIAIGLVVLGCYYVFE